MQLLKPAYIRRHFYRDLFALVTPIVIQNLISSGVDTADVVMLNSVSQTALSASSLANQVMFILHIVYYGLSSALTILAAQYWGSGNRKVISRIFGLGLMVSMSVSTLFSVLALTVPESVMTVWTNDPELIRAGASYLRYVAPAYFFMGITQVYLAIMRSCERVKLSTAVTGSTLLLNVCLNAVLIFGLLGAPRMGIEGAALATSIARGIELVVCIADASRQKVMPLGPRVMFRFDRQLVGDFGRYSLPAFINDAAWGLATSMFSVIMGHLGSDVVAANTVVTVVRNLLTTVGFGIASAASIMIGKELGEDRIDAARDDSRAVLHTAVLVSLATGVLLALISPFVPRFANVTETAKDYLRIMQVISIFYQMGQIVNTVLIAALFRAGGSSRTGMIIDVATMWVYAVPLGLLAAFVWKLPPMVVYALLCTDEFVKLLPAILFYRTGKWLRNLTRPDTETV